MANQAYNGQPINIQFDYEGEGTMDSKLVQLSESAAKDPTTWLKNGIYRIGNGQPVFTQDGKALLYIGRNGNATDIADDTKWLKFTTTADVQAAINNITSSHFAWKGNTATIPANPENMGMYRASATFTIPASSCLSGSAENVEIGDILLAVAVTGANNTSVIKYSVVQNNIDPTEITEGTLGDGIEDAGGEVANPRDGVVLAGYTDENGKLVVCKSEADINAIEALANKVNVTQGKVSPLPQFGDLTGLQRYEKDAAQDGDSVNALFAKFVEDSRYSKCPNYMQSQAFKAQEFVNIPEKCQIAEMTNADGYSCANENTFCTNIITAGIPQSSFGVAYFNYGGADDAPIRVVLAISTTNGASSNFFGFTKSAPKVAALLTRGSEDGTMHTFLTFKNFDREGLLSSPCIEYTYDVTSKVLSYTAMKEVVVSNS